jgi:hypothetical protein
VPPTKEELAPLILWGRCRSGRRWFWAAYEFDGDRAHGWADSEEQAGEDARAAVERLADGRVATVVVRHGVASGRLREVNAEKRKTLATDGAGAAPVEYLYAVAAGHFDGNDDWVDAAVTSFRITRRTAKRVYYVRRERGGEVEIGYVDRRRLEEAGEVVNRGAGGWWAPDHHLYAAPPVLEPARPEPPDVRELKAAMHSAHPDRGGTDEAFIAARERYERAQRADLARLTELVDATPTTWRAS